MNVTQGPPLARMIFETIGWPIGTGSRAPTQEELDSSLEYSFKNRVGLLYLEECLRKGVPFSSEARDMLNSLRHRRQRTDEVVSKLAKILNVACSGRWVTFKSVKPIPSTPNDTDWFPLEKGAHAGLVRMLIESGEFSLLETAPLQVTLIESAGKEIATTEKTGGIYYIDCYVAPSTDYFVYLDPTKIKEGIKTVAVGGEPIPILAPEIELAVTMFHNVFPEKSFSIESYYLIKEYLHSLSQAGKVNSFIEKLGDHAMGLSAVYNLAAVREIDSHFFGFSDPIVDQCLLNLGRPSAKMNELASNWRFPHEFSNAVFWHVFLSKLRDPAARKSFVIQAAHMLNPIFFLDVVRVLWRRCIRGGVYQQN